jgi:hypothetical protein
MKKFKNSLCVILALSILFCGFGKMQTVEAADTAIEFSAKPTSSIMVKTSDSTIQSISLKFDSLSSKGTSGELVFNTMKGSYSAKLSGYFEHFKDANGYVGVFDGILYDYYALTEKDNNEPSITRVTVDVNYISAEDNFTAITIGAAGADVEPTISFFGEYSDSIGKLCEQKRIDVLNKRSSVLQDSAVSSNEPLSVDAATRFQSTATKTASGYSVATISIYYANELRNQSSMSVYAKVNSHTADFKDYLADVHGYDGALSSLIVYPDSWMIETVGADKYLHSNGVINPTASTTSVTLTFPAYLPYIGFFTFNIPLTMTSVSIATRGVAGSPIYSDNIITWDVFMRNGWNASTMDGDYTTETGGCVMVGYTYEDNVTVNRSSSMGAYGAIRYEYVYTPFMGSSITLHMWSDDAICASSLTIVP